MIMASGKTHQAVGALSGGAFAYYRAQGQEPPHILAETLDGLLGGWATSRLPDIFDPPIHPGHRSVGHAVIPVGTAGCYYAQSLGDWQEWLRRAAEEHAAAGSQATSDLDRFVHPLLELLE
jgi:hypothetical protein